MTRRRQGALIAAIILLAVLTYVGAAARHPAFIYNGYDLKEE